MIDNLRGGTTLFHKDVGGWRGLCKNCNSPQMKDVLTSLSDQMPSTE